MVCSHLGRRVAVALALAGLAGAVCAGAWCVVHMSQAAAPRETGVWQVDKRWSGLFEFRPGHPTQLGVGGTWERFSIALWDTRTARAVAELKGHLSKPNAFAFTPDGQRLVSVGMDRRALVWDLERPGLARVLETDYPLFRAALAVSPDGKTVALPGTPDDDVRLMRIVDGRRVRLLHGNGETVEALALSPDGGLLATGTGQGTVTIWNWRRALKLQHFRTRPGCTSLAFGPGGRLLVAAHDNGFVVWDVAGGSVLRRVSDHDVILQCVLFSPDGRYLAGGGGSRDYYTDEGVRIWSTRTWEALWTLPAYESWTEFRFTRDGHAIAVQDTKTGPVHLWALPAGR